MASPRYAAIPVPSVLVVCLYVGPLEVVSVVGPLSGNAIRKCIIVVAGNSRSGVRVVLKGSTPLSVHTSSIGEVLA